MKIVPQLRNCLLSFGCIACDELINILVSNQFDQTRPREETEYVQCGNFGILIKMLLPSK